MRARLEVALSAQRIEPDDDDEGPGRSPAERLALAGFLGERLRDGAAFTFNALFVEPQGGRAYPSLVDRYAGPLRIPRDQYRAARRFLLSAIQRDVRRHLVAPSGWSLMELDFRTCHACIGVTLAGGDPALEADIARDFHAVIGAALFPGHPMERDFGKSFNNAMFFGMGAHGIDRKMRKLLGRLHEKSGEEIFEWWWGRYPGLAAFRDRMRLQVDLARIAKSPLRLVAPSGRVSHFSAAQVRGDFAPGRKAPAPTRRSARSFRRAFARSRATS